MYKITIITGIDYDKDGKTITQDDRNKVPVSNDLQAITVLAGGVTCYEGTGVYQLQNGEAKGKFEFEATRTIIVYVNTKEHVNKIRGIALTMKEVLNQESIVFEVQNTTMELI